MKPSRTALVALPLLVLVNLAVLFLSTSELVNTGVPTMSIEWGFIPISLTDSLTNGSLLDIGYDLLTLFTSTFLHGGFDHFINNMIMLLLFGTLVERQLGALRFLIIYLMSGIIASLGHYCSDIMSPYPLIGASGAISGIMAAFVVCVFSTAKRPNFLRLIGTAFIVQWLFEQVAGVMVETVRIKGGAVAHDAHLAGFIAGLVLSLLIVIFWRRKATEEEAPPKAEPLAVDWDRLISPDQPAPTAPPDVTPEQKRENNPNRLAPEQEQRGQDTPKPVISADETTGEPRASEAPPTVTRQTKIGYQPEKTDSLLD